MDLPKDANISINFMNEEGGYLLDVAITYQSLNLLNSSILLDYDAAQAFVDELASQINNIKTQKKKIMEKK